MKYLTVLLIIIFSTQVSSAQINEFGVFLGGSNFIGDVGATDYISPKKIAYGGLYKWNRSPRHSFRISLIYSELEGKDIDSNDPSRQIRQLEFTNSVLELSTGMEFTFLPFDLHKGSFLATPYLYSGISVAKNDNFFYNNTSKKISEDGSNYAFGIPIVLGYKATLSTSFILALEIGARYTFSDNLDGSIPNSGNTNTALSFGNKDNNDWYVFTGLTLTYTFGRNPCFCPE